VTMGISLGGRLASSLVVTMGISIGGRLASSLVVTNVSYRKERRKQHAMVPLYLPRKVFVGNLLAFERNPSGNAIPGFINLSMVATERKYWHRREAIAEGKMREDEK